MVPGSHKAGQLSHSVKDDPRNMLRTGQSIEVADDIPVELLPVPPGHFSLHHTYLLHNSRANRADDARIGLGISYIPTRCACSSDTRLTAMLVRGTDRYGNFEHETPPAQQPDDAARRTAHEDAMARWNASRAEQVERMRPSQERRLTAGQMRYAGKVVVITGAAQGIGAAMAWRFAEEGARVASLDLRAGGWHCARNRGHSLRRCRPRQRWGGHR